MAADATYPNTFQVRQDGNAAVPTGKSLDIESGGALKIAGTDKTSALAAAVAAPVAGVAAGYKIARGTVTLDGSNPTAAATGLATIVAAVACIKSATAPGDDPVVVTVDYTGANGTLNIYAWKHDGTDPTLVASTNNTVTVDWIAVGT